MLDKKEYLYIGESDEEFTFSKIYQFVGTSEGLPSFTTDDGDVMVITEERMRKEFLKAGFINKIEVVDEEIVSVEEKKPKHVGLRYNSGKPRFDLVHPWSHEQMVNVLTVGANKYHDRNWEDGMAWSNVIASLKRHLNAIEAGEDFDKETGELHAAHIACNAHFLTAYYKIYPQGDDRPHGYLKAPKIALDIDEVLCDWVGDWAEYRGIEAPKSWWFDRGLMEEFEKMKSEDRLEEFYLSLNPLISPDDIPFEPHCYITSRPVSTEVTEKWLEKHGFPARPVFTTGVGCSKVDIAKREEVDIFVDDAFHNFKALNEAGICCFLMDAPHNQRYEVGFKRITNLKQLM